MKRILTCLTTFTLILAACADPDETAAVDPTESTWELESGTLDGGPVPIVDGFPLSLSFTEDGVGGTAACNGYGGSYTISGNEITFSELVQTEMACTPDEVMGSERAFLDGLARVESFSATEESLNLTGEGVELSFDLSSAPGS